MRHGGVGGNAAVEVQIRSNWVAMTSSSSDGIGPVDYCLPSTAPTKD